ncbi:hypothetical protein CES86_3610 [Brucella lupini]|uniref:Uncharacterized protein n=1 Tax=Brucella lupini TaxID=255457 RepID=A0A256GIB3_9HYPH|nr:hypothetical protein CES86_3610 [Brucella lupini]
MEKNCDIAKIIHRAFQCPFTISNSGLKEAKTAVGATFVSTFNLVIC